MDTIMAPLTPVQKAAAIILRVSGDINKAAVFFETAAPLRHRTATRGRYISRTAANLRDDVLITYFHAPHSYTGEDLLEISFHGNPLIVHSAMREFLDAGIRMAEPGEFTRRAYLHGKLTLTQAEAVDQLVNAATAAGVSRAHHALEGGLDDLFDGIRRCLLTILAHAEAEIDFAESADVPMFDIAASIRRVKERLSDLKDRYRRARLSFQGIKTVIAGAPNAGKSTLFNAFVGEERAIVASEAGTTRDWLTEPVVMEGLHFHLTDTAGLRDTDSAAEKEGVSRARKMIREADLLILLIDLSADLSAEVKELIRETDMAERIMVGTKSDLPRRTGGLDVDREISVKTGEGMKELKALIGKKVAGLTGQLDDIPAPANERQFLECLAAAEELSFINGDLTLDLLAYHLRRAAEAMDRARGKQVGEEALDKLFSQFCIGK